MDVERVNREFEEEWKDFLKALGFDPGSICKFYCQTMFKRGWWCGNRVS